MKPGRTSSPRPFARLALGLTVMLACGNAAASACDVAVLQSHFASGAVHLVGAVAEPGAVVPDDGARASDVIKQAGGLVDGAFPLGAVLLRPSTGVASGAARGMARTSTATQIAMGASGSDAILDAARDALATDGCLMRVPVAVDAVTRMRDPDADAVLQGGDVLFVPYRAGSVAVVGAVSEPGLVDFEPGATVAAYIERAGGWASGAHRGEVTVYLPQGSARPLHPNPWHYQPENVPPGSVIRVPGDGVPSPGVVPAGASAHGADD